MDFLRTALAVPRCYSALRLLAGRDPFHYQSCSIGSTHGLTRWDQQSAAPSCGINGCYIPWLSSRLVLDAPGPDCPRYSRGPFHHAPQEKGSDSSLGRSMLLEERCLLSTLIALVDSGVDLQSATDSPYYDFTSAYDAYNQQTAASTATRWSRTPACSTATAPPWPTPSSRASGGRVSARSSHGAT